MAAAVANSGAFSILILALLNAFLYNNRREIRTISEPKFEYDYIVVGSGPAGSTVASKLATQSDSSVLLVEAGDKPSEHGKIPGIGLMLYRTEIDWDYLTVPQENALQGYNNQQLRWPQGRAIGGTSSLNGMVYFWPSLNDMENWANVTRDDTFRFKNMIKHFQRMENAREIANRSADRGENGPIRLSSLNCPTSPLCSGFLEAARYYDLPVNDVNSWNQYGVMPPQRTIHEGKRWSAVDSYLLPALKDTETDLDILSNSLVQKILVENDKASSVQIRLESGKVVSVSAKKEIIVAAGAIGSPKLLLLSGIGPRRHLNQLRIPVIKDLPVGNNLQDHPRFVLYYTLESWAAPNRTSTFDPAQWNTYLKEGTGALGNTAQLAMGRFPRPSGRPGDFLLTLQSPGISEPEFLNSVFNYKPGAVHVLIPDPANLSAPVASVEVMLLHPLSRGTVRLHSNDPNDRPLMDPKYLQEEDDVNTILEAIKLAVLLTDSPSMQRLGMKLHVPDIEECRPAGVPAKQWRPSLESEEFVRCWIRYAVRTNHHLIGTCRMGQPSDPTTVVDTKFRVLGIPNLRVVDSSIFPVNVACNTQGPVYGISDLAADIILEDNGETKTPVTKSNTMIFSDVLSYLKNVKNWQFPDF